MILIAYATASRNLILFLNIEGVKEEGYRYGLREKVKGVYYFTFLFPFLDFYFYFSDFGSIAEFDWSMGGLPMQKKKSGLSHR